MNVFTENNVTVEIHFTNENETEMMVYLTNQGKTYFVSITEHFRQLTTMKCPYIKEIERVIQIFLDENNR